MKLAVKRAPSSKGRTFGSLWINGAFECFTLEDEVREPAGWTAAAGPPVSTWKIDHDTAIPALTYSVTIDWSNRFKRYMPHILGVPGFIGIRMHSGNTIEQTDGCPLLGKIKRPDEILDSRAAFDAFFPKIAIQDGVDELRRARFRLREPATITFVNGIVPVPEDRVWPNG